MESDVEDVRSSYKTVQYTEYALTDVQVKAAIWMWLSHQGIQVPNQSIYRFSRVSPTGLATRLYCQKTLHLSDK